jgi:hypothetical protein
MQIDKLTITYRAGDDKTDDVFVKAIKMKVRAKMLDDHRNAMKQIDEVGKPGPSTLQANFTAAFIANSICDESGNPLYKPDDVDDWHPAKIGAYEKAIVAYQNPNLETVAKNSTTTPNNAT